MNEDEKEKLAWSLAKQRTEKRAAWQWANEESRSRFSLLAYLLTWTLKSSSKRGEKRTKVFLGILGGLVGISLGIGFLSALQSRIEGYQDLLVGPPFSVQGSAVEVIVYVVFGLILVLAMGITYDWCQIQKHQQRIKSDFNQLISQLTYREQKALKPNSSIWLPWVAPIFPILYFIDWASTWAGWQFVMMFFIVVWLPYTGYYFWHYKPNTTA